MLPETHSNARRCDRIFVKIPVWLFVEMEGEKAFHDASTIDLSPRGVRVRMKVALAPGQAIEVVPNEEHKDAVPSRVIWVGAAGSERSGEAGLEFLKPLRVPA